MTYSDRYMMVYFMWRVMGRLNKEITISFLLVGHTKLAPWPVLEIQEDKDCNHP